MPWLIIRGDRVRSEHPFGRAALILPPGIWSNVDRGVEAFPPEWIGVVRNIVEGLRGDVLTDIAVDRNETLIAILEEDGSVYAVASSVFSGVELEKAILATTEGVWVPLGEASTSDPGAGPGSYSRRVVVRGVEILVEDMPAELRPIVEEAAQDFERRFRALVELFERPGDPYASKGLLRESLRLGRSVELRVLDEVRRRKDMYLLIPPTSEHFFKYLEEIYTLNLDPTGRESEEALARAVTKTLETILPGGLDSTIDVKRIAADIAKKMVQKPLFRIAVEAFKRGASGTFSEILRSYANAISLNRLAMEIFLSEYGEKLRLSKISDPLKS